MSIDHLRSSFLGFPLQNNLNQRNYGSSAFVLKHKLETRVSAELLCPRESCRGCHAIKVLQFGRRNGEIRGLSSRNLVLGSRLKVHCVNEPLSRSRALIRGIIPPCREGLLLVRCSVFVAVISVIGMLIWYGQVKARTFVEVQLLPSICSILSNHLHRDITVGKVQRISPLSISLQSCSIGPHHEEFSCGESPMMKLRLRPFASLRRGKIVIDAVLSHPCVLIAQKEDFSWLGIPSPSENGYLNHSSKEEGIDYRTKTRRVAREEAAAQWAGERSSEARKAAEMGYISHHPQISDPSTGDESIDSANHSTETPPSASFLCTGDRMLWRDHHCMDMGIGYGSKHADLEKSFGVKIPLARFKFWPGIRHRFRRKVRKKDLSSASATVKRRILEQSAAAALAYFRGSDSGKPSDAQDEEIVVKNKENSSGNTAELLKNEEHVTATWNEELLQDSFPCSLENFSESVDVEKQVKQASFEIPTLGRRGGVVSPSPKNASMEHGIISGEEFPNRLRFMFESFLMAIRKISRTDILSEKYPLKSTNTETGETSACNSSRDNLRRVHIGASHVDSDASSNGLHDSMQGTIRKGFEGDKGHESQDDIAQVSNVGLAKIGSSIEMSPLIQIWPSSWNFKFPFWPGKTITLLLDYLAHHFQEVKSYMSIKPEHFVAEFAEGLEEVTTQGINKMLPVTVDAVYFTGGTLMLLGYGDQEPREMENVRGHVKFQNHYSQVHVQLSGNCKEWRTELTSKVGGWLSADVFVDSIEQKWHANLKIADLFAPLFERILEIPITWSKGRASGEVHVCMSRGETFPNLHGQLDVKGLAFQIIDAPSSFSEVTASLCFRGQRIFLHNASGWFGDVPLEASGDFGINPQDGEFHLMCQVPSVELNALMKTFKMKPLLFPVAGLVTAVFNCQGPLDAPVLVGSGMISRKTSPSVVNFPVSSATEAVMKNKGAGAVAALDRIPFSYVSANFTYNTDNSVADLYGIRASLLDGGEIRGAGNAWICKEGEVDDFALDVNLSGNLSFDKVLYRYLSREIQLMPLKIGDINGETKLSGSLLRPRFDIKWAAPKAEESFSDARGDIFISHEYITINSSSVAFDLYMKVNTSHPDEHWQTRKDFNVRGTMLPAIEGIELDLRMRGFEFFSLISSNPFGSPRPMHLKVNGKIKFQGCVVKYIRITEDKDLGLAKNVRITKEKELGFAKNVSGMNMVGDEPTSCLVGDVSLSGIKLNQLMLAPQLVGSLNVSRENMKLDVTGRPDENLTLEVSGQIHPTKQENFQKKTVVSVSLQKGQLRANICYQPQISVNLEVRHLPLDELELASLRGTVQKAELQLNFQKWRGHGNLSVIRPRFSGVQGEALDVSARWSGDVITIEKTVLEQASSRYELQGEYVLPGTRDRYPVDKVRGGLLKRAMTGHLGSVISSMGRWRMRLEVPGAEVAEMLPLAQLLSRSTDPAVRSRSKDLFMEGLQFVGFYAESLRDQLEAIRRHYISSDEVLGEMKLPGLAELKGRWRGSLDASGGGNGDTRADFDFHGEDWEWGTYKTQRVLAVGAYSNNDGLRLERIFIQRDNATLHADGTFLGPKTNLHFAVLNFPVGLVPTLLQVIESSTTDSVHSHRQLLTPIKGILHMEGDLRGSLAKPECDVQVRLLDGAIGGIDLGRAEVVASITSVRRFLFNANFAPAIQNGHVHIQGSIPITPFQYDLLEEEEMERDTGRAKWVQGWMKDKVRGTDSDVTNKEKFSSDRGEEGWEVHLAESLKGLNWNILDEGEVKIDADIKDGGMMLITALCPYVNWLHGNADIILQVRGTVEQPVVDGTASFHRASVSSPVLPKPLSNFGGTVHVKSNRLCISALESRVSRRGRLLVKGNLPLNPSESFPGDKIDLKCEVLEVRAKNMLSGQVDSQIQVTGSIMQPIVSGMIKLSHGEAYLPHDKGTGAAINRLASNKSSLSTGGFSGMAASGLVSRFFSAEPAPSDMKVNQPSGQQDEVEKKKEQTTTKPRVDVRLMDLKLHLGPELRIVYPLIVNFAVRGELELNGLAHPKWIKPKGILTFENGDVNLVATQVRLKRDHLNIAKFEPDLGLDPTLDLVLVGSEWQFRIQSRASNWQDNLVVTSMRSVEQDVLSPSEAARVFESQLAESLLEGDGQLAFKKLAAATVESLMPKIEGKGEFGQARWRLVYAPQIPSLLSVDSTADPLKSLTNNISFGTEVEVQLGKRLQASISRQMKDSEMAMKWTLLYQLTSRLRILFQSSPSNRLLFEYSATSQD